MSDRAGLEANLEALYEDAACALLITDADGLLLRVNSRFTRWTGLDAAAVVGRRKFHELLSAGGRIFVHTHLVPLLQLQGSVAEVKLDVLDAQGSAMPMVVNIVRTVAGDRVRHHVAMFHAKDRHQYEKELLLARRRAEELLEAEQQARQALAIAQEAQNAAAEDRAVLAEQMIGIVSHDLRTPLAAIHMSALLLGRGELAPHQLRVIERLNSATSRAQRLIADLLDFTQARLGGGLKTTLRPLDLHDHVAGVVEELAIAFGGRQLVHRRLGSGGCQADADRLAQLIGNLVANAMAYGRPDGVVTVTSEVGETECRVLVHNHGEPIGDAALKRIFEPMTRGLNTSVDGRSVGLGLFIVRAIAAAHGGDVQVLSNHASGTTFTVRLPRQPS